MAKDGLRSHREIQCYWNEKKQTKEEGLVWAKHCGEEIGNWGVFLPQLYNLFKVVTNTKFNPYTHLTVEGKGEILIYKFIQQQTRDTGI